MGSGTQGEDNLDVVKVRIDQLERDLFRSKTLILAAGFGLLVALGLSWGNISSKIEGLLKQSAIGTLKTKAEASANDAATAATHAKEAESRAKISTTRLAELVGEETKAIEVAGKKLKNGEFEGDILVKGNVVAQGKISSGGGLGRGQCTRVDSSANDGDLWCPEGFYVAGARNWSKASYILDMIYCCPLR